jgi:alkyl sulfatase BDS1-like metallo-beta-lactamase superfamily hydrolase
MRIITAALASLVLASAAMAQTPPPAPHDAPSQTTRAANARMAAELPFSNTQDFDFARRGFIATRADPLIKNAAGAAVWDLNQYDFTRGDVPATVNPSLWRQAQLMSMHGLFQVSDRIWQVRGFDLANITFVRGSTGWIVIDTLGSAETARAALDLINEKVGARPVKAIIYTHAHTDHFGGAGGLATLEDVRAGRVLVLAPQGFMHAAVSENVIAGPAMQRRAAYQFGVPLPKGVEGQVNAGIGPALAVGTSALIPPTREVTETGRPVTVDGVKLLFQLTPNTESPAEMNVAFPDWRIVDLAENANATQHNILTPRGAVVRDAKVWAENLTRALDMFGGYDTLIASHGWPRFGQAVIADYIGKHRDAYAFLHDQTVRMLNQGLTGDEIAARIRLPAALEQQWYDRPYYGSLSFNSRAVYQFYMGWYDANPVNLAPNPPAETGRRYVEAMGGAEKVRTMAQASYDAGDYAWAAELLNHVVMSDATDAAARALLARCYEQLAWQSENSLWRNIYLTGASELRGGAPAPSRPAATQAAVIANLPTPMLFDLLAVRLNAERVGADKLRLAFVFTDRNERTYVTVENGVLIHRPIAAPGPVDATLTMTRPEFLAAVLGGLPLAPTVQVAGDRAALTRFTGWFDQPRSNFPIVTR